MFATFICSNISHLFSSIFELYARRNARMQNIAISTLTMTTDIAAAKIKIAIAACVAFIVQLLLGV